MPVYISTHKIHEEGLNFSKKVFGRSRFYANWKVAVLSANLDRFQLHGANRG
jgi:hypothetical protein